MPDCNCAYMLELKTIDIGDTLPNLTLKNEKDEDVEISSLATEKGVVFFLVPKADTRTSTLISGELVTDITSMVAGCTTQACGFRDVYPDFTSSGFDVYCLSADSPSAQSKWQTKVSVFYAIFKSAILTVLSRKSCHIP